ncbi:MAG: hypothetical protein DPW09_04670 [Anaerolineae bacterium]|nr:hypothetical protein [Anaerolineae bacterium]
METKGKGVRAEQPDEGDEQINQQRFTPTVGWKKEDRAAALHEADGVEAVNRRVEKKAQGVAG